MKRRETMNPGDLGAFIRELRLAHGYTQAQLGEFVGLSRTSVTNIENGRQTITFAVMRDLLDVFGYRLRVEISPK